LTLFIRRHIFPGKIGPPRPGIDGDFKIHKPFGSKLGDRLRALRLRAGLSIRAVENQSRQIAEAEGNAEYFVSNGWITRIENSDSVPGIHKLTTLSVVYRTSFYDLAVLAGIDPSYIGRAGLARRNTQDRLRATARSDRITDPQATLLSRFLQGWEGIPHAALKHLDFRRNHYGFIGFDDYTLYPLVRPGTLVQIDTRMRKIEMKAHRSQFDRPIYFLQLRDRFACGWCEIDDRVITLVPHPLSPCHTQEFQYPSEVTIVGQVTAIAMTFANSLSGSSQPSESVGVHPSDPEKESVTQNLEVV
jgi:transcriptional regulator with XRE-family HTH domain